MTYLVFAFWCCLFLQCCFENLKRFWLFTQEQVENHILPIHVYSLQWCEWTNRANSYIIHTADQQASWNKLHVSKSNLSNLCPKLYPPCSQQFAVIPLHPVASYGCPLCTSFYGLIQSSPFQWIIFYHTYTLLYFLTEIPTCQKLYEFLKKSLRNPRLPCWLSRTLVFRCQSICGLLMMFSSLF